MNAPSVRFVRTTHGLDGESAIASDSALEQFHPLGPGGPVFNIMDVRTELPVDNANPPERSLFASCIPWCPPSGMSVYLLDMPGGYEQSTMHRTLSVDYIFIVSGQISLGLATEEVLLQAGDCVQIQGCDHRWMNKDEEPCRLLCFAAAAKDSSVEKGNKGPVP